MKEGFKEFYFSLLTKLKVDIPEDVSLRKDTKSEGNLQDFIDIIRETKSGQGLLLSLVHQLCEGESNRVAHVVQPHAAGIPGFSNNPLAQLEQYREVQATIAWKGVVAAMVTKEQAKKHEPHAPHLQ